MQQKLTNEQRGLQNLEQQLGMMKTQMDSDLRRTQEQLLLHARLEEFQSRCEYGAPIKCVCV